MVGLSSKSNRDHSSPTLGTVIDFLTSLFTKGLGYSCIDIARSALSCIMYTDSTFCNCSIHQDVFENWPNTAARQWREDLNELYEAL